jgi:hypothetical protein
VVRPVFEHVETRTGRRGWSPAAAGVARIDNNTTAEG